MRLTFAQAVGCVALGAALSGLGCVVPDYYTPGGFSSTYHRRVYPSVSRVALGWSDRSTGEEGAGSELDRSLNSVGSSPSPPSSSSPSRTNTSPEAWPNSDTRPDEFVGK